MEGFYTNEPASSTDTTLWRKPGGDIGGACQLVHTGSLLKVELTFFVLYGRLQDHVKRKLQNMLRHGLRSFIGPFGQFGGRVALGVIQGFLRITGVFLKGSRHLSPTTIHHRGFFFRPTSHRRLPARNSLPNRYRINTRQSLHSHQGRHHTRTSTYTQTVLQHDTFQGISVSIALLIRIHHSS